MQVPGGPSLFFLAYILALLPFLAVRSAKRLAVLQQGAGGTALPAREAIWAGTLLTQIVLLILAWAVGSSFGFEPFAGASAIGFRALFAGLVALGLCFLLRAILRKFRSDEERKKLLVFRMVPRSRREWALSTLVVLLASVTEEAAYRGVAMSILWYSLGNPWLAALICAMAFAAAHWTQGAKSGAVIFLIALIMHGLVAVTGTLVLAMVVHAIYDFVAGYLISQEARRFELEGATDAPSGEIGSVETERATDGIGKWEAQ